MSKQKVIRLWVLIIILVITAGSVQADTYYVNAACGNDSWTGTDPCCIAPDGPKATIQAGISAASGGDTIIVAQGTYTGTGNRDIDFLGKAITLQSENGPETCIIDCQATFYDTHRGFYFHSGENSNSVLKGFTINNGYRRNQPGGGIYCEASSPRIEDCIIEGNTTKGSNGTSSSHKGNDGLGGGIYCYSSNPAIIDCIITDNLAQGGNGLDGQCGMTDCYGPGTGGKAYGGGIYCTSNSHPVLNNCTVEGNRGYAGHAGDAEEEVLLQAASGADARGGGIYCGSDCTVELYNCILSENQVIGGNSSEILWIDGASGGPACGEDYVARL
ncbi:MAG: hypothetical protein JW860_10995 [Sedimentisphaerales bacterium]|nr:hypothetical protein [Sedimentisphaerales bacterium]